MIKQKDLKTILIEFKLKCVHFTLKIPENKREILIKIAKTKAIFYQMISQSKAKQSTAIGAMVLLKKFYSSLF